jgi:hypothetical protein
MLLGVAVLAVGFGLVGGHPIVREQEAETDAIVRSAALRGRAGAGVPGRLSVVATNFAMSMSAANGTRLPVPFERFGASVTKSSAAKGIAWGRPSSPRAASDFERGDAVGRPSRPRGTE